MIIVYGELEYVKTYSNGLFCLYENQQKVVLHDCTAEVLKNICDGSQVRVLPLNLSINQRPDGSKIVHMGMQRQAQMIDGSWYEKPEEYWILSKGSVKDTLAEDSWRKEDVVPLMKDYAVYRAHKNTLARFESMVYANVFGVYPCPPAPTVLAVRGAECLSKWYDGIGRSVTPWQVYIQLAQVLFAGPRQSTEQVVHDRKYTVLAKRMTWGKGVILGELVDLLGFTLGGSVVDTTYTRESIKEFVCKLPTELAWMLVSGVRITEFLTDTTGDHSSKVEALLLTENINLWIEVMAKYIVTQKRLGIDILKKTDRGYDLSVSRNSLHICTRAYNIYLKPLLNRR